ncbi:MAG: DeoR/GlpR family DNA-binding transcription regulator [Chloroflexota bacterium]|nr:DeoR/GlpR family DNA-binding transcription regulator [Chloroflexota bacterium]
MDKASLVPEERRRRIAERIRENGSVTVAMLEAEFGVSPMTARRDLSALEAEGRARRTHGGAVLPGVAGHEDSFQQRLDVAVEAKQRLARAAVQLLEPGETVFIDSSTSAYYAARGVLTDGLKATLLTNSVPVMDLFSEKDSPNVDLVGVGGSLRKRTLSFVGPQAVRAVQAFFADKVFLSVKGVTPDGYLTDPDPLEAEVKRAMIGRAEQPVLLVDRSKFEQRGLSVIAHISDLAMVLAADIPDEGLESLTSAGVEVRQV